jgi:hypothetical protein
MARLNTLNLNFGPRTHEGAPASHISPELQLRRSVLACLLWESQFYEDGADLVEVPARRGFALRDAIDASQQHSATYLGKAVEELNRKEKYDRLIVITDEQAHDTVPAPKGTGYVINVASYKNGVGYRKWIHIDGWSESVVEYIRALEGTHAA